MRMFTNAAGLAAVMLAASPLVASAPAAAQDRPGRYAMSPVEGGFARLDTETGQMSICRDQKDAGGVQSWACQPMADPGGGDDRARKLEAENKELRAEIRRMEDQLGLNGPKDGQKQAERHRRQCQGRPQPLPQQGPSRVGQGGFDEGRMPIASGGARPTSRLTHTGFPGANASVSGAVSASDNTQAAQSGSRPRPNCARSTGRSRQHGRLAA